jgi:hypothetical protein
MARKLALLNSKNGEAERFTIAEAFLPHQEHDDGTGPEVHRTRTKLFDIERELRAVSLLIFHLSEDGNSPLDGMIAVGLSNVLDECARELADLSDQIGAADSARTKPAPASYGRA